MKNSFSVLAVVLMVLANQRALAIVNGTAVDPNTRPEVGLLVLPDEPMPIVSAPIDQRQLPNSERCTGSFISDSLFLTAGHCVRGPSGDLTFYLVKWLSGGRAALVPPVKVTSPYVYEEIRAPETTGPVPGCSVGQKPLPQTKTWDLAVVEFPKGTATSWFKINVNFTPLVDRVLGFLGFGWHFNPLIGDGLPAKPKATDLMFGSGSLWRWSEQRLAMITPDTGTFAVDGDSGGPVLADDKLVGVMSTFGTKCDTELGEDYAIMNTATRLTPESLKELNLKVNSKGELDL